MESSNEVCLSRLTVVADDGLSPWSELRGIRAAGRKGASWAESLSVVPVQRLRPRAAGWFAIDDLVGPGFFEHPPSSFSGTVEVRTELEVVGGDQSDVDGQFGECGSLLVLREVI